MRSLPLILMSLACTSWAMDSDWNRKDYPGGDYNWFEQREPVLWLGEVPDGRGAVANFATGAYDQNLKISVEGRDVTLSKLEWRDSGAASNGLSLEGMGGSRLILQAVKGQRPSVTAYNTRIALAIELSGEEGVDFNIPTGEKTVFGTIQLSGASNELRGGLRIGGTFAPDSKNYSRVIAARGCQLGNSPIEILKGGTLQANWAGAIAPEGTLSLEDGARLILEFKNDTMTVRTLELAGRRVPAGTYMPGDAAIKGFIEGKGGIEVLE